MLTSGKAQRVADDEFEFLRTNGIKVNYAVICQRKLWLYAKGFQMERLSDRVALGRLMHERAYPRLPRREIFVDELIKVDLLEAEDKLLEVKYSRKLIEASRLQVAYYLMCLERLGATGLIGELRFPKEKRREEVVLTPELQARVLEMLREVQRIEALPAPPSVDFMPICRLCAYAELCWG